MWLNSKVKSPFVNNNKHKKWIGGNRDASQVAIKQRVNQIGIRPSNTNNADAFNKYKDVNNVNDALTRVRAGGTVAPLKKSTNNFKGPTPRYPVGPLIRTVNKAPVEIQSKTGMIGKNVKIMSHMMFH